MQQVLHKSRPTATASNIPIAAGPWLIQLFLGVANWFVLCIALNLQLVLVHSVNGLALEKYYIIIPIVLNLATTLPPRTSTALRRYESTANVRMVV